MTARFFRKILIFPKRPKNRVFGLLLKIESLVFARNDQKWSVLWSANFMRKPHICTFAQKSSQILLEMTKNGAYYGRLTLCVNHIHVFFYKHRGYKHHRAQIWLRFLANFWKIIVRKDIATWKASVTPQKHFKHTIRGRVRGEIG